MSTAQWSRFAGGLIDYINRYYSCFIKTDYKIDLDMSQSEILEELINKSSINELSKPLRIVAEQYLPLFYKQYPEYKREDSQN